MQVLHFLAEHTCCSLSSRSGNGSQSEGGSSSLYSMPKTAALVCYGCQTYNDNALAERHTSVRSWLRQILYWHCCKAMPAFVNNHHNQQLQLLRMLAQLLCQASWIQTATLNL